jgi:hypothetical protein
VEIEQHVRALIRDVVCGYLEPDLRSVADDILIAGDEPIEIRAHDTREEADAGVRADAEEDPDAADEPDPSWEHPAVNAETRLPDGPGTAADPRSSAWAVTALPGPRTFREAEPPRVEDRVEVEDDVVEDDVVEAAGDAVGASAVQPELDAGVIHSADWDADDDPSSYSAPI